jgi:secreted trypsin-like serine protease
MFKAFLLFFLVHQAQLSLANFYCGQRNLQTGLIAGGSYSSRGKWPWAVAIFKKASLEYHCSGSLITQLHVLSVAHCVHEKHQPISTKAEELRVVLGKQNLFKHEDEAEGRDVAKIIVHPDWKYNDARYDADIAILVLDGIVNFNHFIAPVCLPTNENEAIMTEGTVVS